MQSQSWSWTNQWESLIHVFELPYLGSVYLRFLWSHRVSNITMRSEFAPWDYLGISAENGWETDLFWTYEKWYWCSHKKLKYSSGQVLYHKPTWHARLVYHQFQKTKYHQILNQLLIQQGNSTKKMNPVQRPNQVLIHRRRGPLPVPSGKDESRLTYWTIPTIWIQGRGIPREGPQTQSRHLQRLEGLV